MPYTCAIETSGRYYSLAIINNFNAEILAQYQASTVNSQAGTIANTFADLLRAAKLNSPSDLNYIALNIGPGSFTGIRIGIAFAQGLLAGINSARYAGYSAENSAKATTELLAFNTMQILAGHKRYCLKERHVARNTELTKGYADSAEAAAVGELALLVAPAHAGKCYVQLWDAAIFQAISEMAVTEFNLDSLKNLSSAQMQVLFNLAPNNADGDDARRKGLAYLLEKGYKLIMAQDYQVIAQGEQLDLMVGSQQVVNANFSAVMANKEANVKYLAINAENLARLADLTINNEKLLAEQRKITPFPLYIGDAFAGF